MTIIIDYGIGNVFSVQRSLEHCGEISTKLSSDPHEILSADRIVLPGVGAFKDGMDGLRKRNLIEPLLESIKEGKPVLGICLGMQMLSSSSYEFGNHEGLDLIPGSVVPIINEHELKSNTKIPFIGWANLNIKKDKSKNNILEHLNNQYVYLVHSYHVKTDNEKHTIATYNYDNKVITAAIQNENVIGFQFHPEKSGEVGLNILRKFINL